MEIKQSNRIQTSLINAAEKKALVYLAGKQPKWVTSDHLTFLGFVGALIIGAGYVLTNWNINWLWLSSFGFFVNWYGDSLDGTLARVRQQQRPIYGYYLDHTVDGINECIMFVCIGFSALMSHPGIAIAALILYLLLSMNVNVNAHLKGEFKLTYLKLGPTEFRIIMVIINTLLVLIKPLSELSLETTIFAHPLTLSLFDIAGAVIVLILLFIYLTTIYHDAKYYAKIDPRKDK